MKTDNEIIQAGFDSIFSNLGMVEAERFIMLIKRDKGKSLSGQASPSDYCPLSFGVG